MKINRKEFLEQLESVQPGLSPTEIIEQSSHFIFQNGFVYTYNDEVACSRRSLLEANVAVPAKPLVSLLQRLGERELEIDIKKGYLSIKGKRKRAGIKIEQEIVLPIDTIKPERWGKLPDGFLDAIAIVQPCAGSNETQFVMTCVHIHPDWMEACDNFQAARYKIKTGVKKSILIRKESLQYILSSEEESKMTKFSETKHWIHFKNVAGLTFSCRRFVENYPSREIGEILQMKGEPLTLPENLTKAIRRAEIFSSENVSGNDIIVSLGPNLLHLVGRGALGWFEEKRKLEYSGKPLRFTIPPKLLSELIKQYNECQVNPSRLKVKGKKFVYVVALGKGKD